MKIEQILNKIKAKTTSGREFSIHEVGSVWIGNQYSLAQLVRDLEELEADLQGLEFSSSKEHF